MGNPEDYFLKVDWQKLSRDLDDFTLSTPTDDIAKYTQIKGDKLAALALRQQPIDAHEVMILSAFMRKPLSAYVKVDSTISDIGAEQVDPDNADHLPDVNMLVRADLLGRAMEGERKYGKRLRPFNRRSALVDAYQEAMDQVVYLRQAIAEGDLGDLTLDHYQELCRKYMVPELDDIKMLALSVAEEGGEVAGKIKRIFRDQGGVVKTESLDAVVKEMGDVLWTVAMLADKLGVSFADVARANIDKLEGRYQRGTLKGSGDNR